MLKGVVLVGVGRNLNRAVRTCYTFGIYDLYCIDCAEVEDRLFSAHGKVRLNRVSMCELRQQIDTRSILALERSFSIPSLHRARLSEIEYLAVGGESVTLRSRDFPRMARIETTNDLCLTTEAALAIGAYELRQGGDAH